MRGLLLDFGGVVLRTPFEVLGDLERRAGLAAGTLAWPGPFDPAGDELWRSLQAGRVSERAYWQARAAQAGRRLGVSWSIRDLMVAAFAGPEEEVVRPETRRLVADARAAGLRTGVLTNDLHDFQGASWVARMSVFGGFDVLVDGSVTGVLKPDPASYGRALEALGLGAAEVLFVDDQPANLDGARRAGLATEPFDVTDPAASVARVRRRLGL